MAMAELLDPEIPVIEINIEVSEVGAQGPAGVPGPPGPQGPPGPSPDDAPVDGHLYGRSDAAWAQIDGVYAPVASPVFNGNPRAPTPAAGDNDTSVATTAFVNNAIAGPNVSNVVSLLDVAVSPLDATLGSIFELVATGDRQIVPVNAPALPGQSQKIILRLMASGADRLFSLGAGAGGFRFGSLITGLTTTLSGKTDYVGAIWNATGSCWDVVSYAKGY